MSDALTKIVAAAEAWSDEDDEYEYDDEEEEEEEEEEDSSRAEEEDSPPPPIRQSALKRFVSEGSSSSSMNATTMSVSTTQKGENEHSDTASVSLNSSPIISKLRKISPQAAPIALPPPDGTLCNPFCPHCKSENHIPVTCQVVQAWKGQLNQPYATACLSPPVVQLLVELFCRQWAQKYRLNEAQAWTRLRWAHWNSRLAAINAHGTTVIDVGGGFRALSAILSNETVDYSQTQSATQGDCSICLETNVLLKDLGCGHGYCHDCWNQYLSIHVQGPAVVTLSCPNTQCKTLVTTDFVQAMCPTADMARYLMESFVQTKPGLTCCPGPDCRQVLVKGRPDPTWRGLQGLDAAQCTSCQTQFCFQCGEAPHDIQPCRSRVTTSTTVSESINPEHQTRKEEHTKVCPRCRALIQRVIGCHRMSCRCGYIFCWNCFADMKSGYGHDCGGDQAEVQEELVIDFDYVMNSLNHMANENPIYNIQAKISLERTMQRMQNFAPHFNPFYKHHVGQSLATTRGGAASSENTKAAHESLAMARRLLKYSYVQFYDKRNEQAPTGGDASLELDHCVLAGLFEMYLEQLDRHTERLSELCLQEPTVVPDIIGAQVSVVHRCMNSLVDLCR